MPMIDKSTKTVEQGRSHSHTVIGCTRTTNTNSEIANNEDCNNDKSEGQNISKNFQNNKVIDMPS